MRMRLFALAAVAALAAAPVRAGEIPASVIGLWDASAHAASGGGGGAITNEADPSRFDLVPGAAAPTVEIDAFGRPCLRFEAGTTDPLVTSPSASGGAFFDTADPREPWAMILCVRALPGDLNADEQQIFGAERNRRTFRFRASTQPGAVDVVFMEFGQSPATNTLLKHRVEDDGMFIVVASHDGATRTTEIFNDHRYFGEAKLPLTVQTKPSSHDGEPIEGDLIFNPGRHGCRLYGAVYLENPTDADLAEAREIAIERWFARERPVMVFHCGDSLTDVRPAFPDRLPGWTTLLSEILGRSRFVSIQSANAGARVIPNGQNAVTELSSHEVAMRYTEVFAGAGWDVFHTIVVGTNDIGGDGASPGDVAAATEAWAAEVEAAGGKPVYLACAFDYQGDGAGEGRGLVFETIDANRAGGAFVHVSRTLADDAVWGVGNQVNLVAPGMMADTTHPNALGNADIASKIAGELAGVFGLGPAPCNLADLAEPYGLIDLGDVTAFVTAFTAGDLSVDFDHSGLLDLADAVAFAGAASAGCGP